MSGATHYLVGMSLAVAMQETSKDQWVSSFSLDNSVSGISAHFPNKPILAGYLQLSFVENFLKQVAPSWRVEKIIEAKFSAQIAPPVEITISITLMRCDRMVRFSISDSSGVKTQGRLGVSEL